jgi:hypothetical protein
MLCKELPNGLRLRSTPAQRPAGVGMPLQGYWCVGRDNAILLEPTPSHANGLTA